MKNSLRIIISTIVCMFLLNDIVISEQYHFLEKEKTGEEKIILWKFIADEEQAKKDGYKDNRGDYEKYGTIDKLLYSLNLGYLYYNGQFENLKVKKDYQEAYKWFFITANNKAKPCPEEDNHPDSLESLKIAKAQMMVAKMLYEGKGVDINYSESYKFAHKAYVSVVAVKSIDVNKKDFENIYTEAKKFKTKILSSNLISKIEAKKIECSSNEFSEAIVAFILIAFLVLIVIAKVLQ